MKKKITDDLILLKTMIKDQSKKYKVDPFWSNYEYLTISKIKHLNLEKFLQFTNSFGGITSIRYSFLGNYFIRFYFGILSKFKKYLKIDLSFPYIFKTLNLFNYKVDDPKLSRKNLSKLIFKLINTLPGAEKLLEINDDLVWSPVDVLELREKKYSFKFIDYFCDFLIVNKFSDFNESKFFLEIGGGYGGFTEVVKKINPNIKIIYVDIAPQLYVAEQYLKSIFSGKVGSYTETKEMKTINRDSFKNYDIIIVPAWDVKKIEDNLIDIFYNSNSFQEMQKNTVDDYCKQLGRIVKNKIVLLEQREGNGAIIDPVTRNEYIKYMKLNNFKLIEEKLANYGGHLRIDPKAWSHLDFYFFEKNK